MMPAGPDDGVSSPRDLTGKEVVIPSAYVDGSAIWRKDDRV